MRVIVEVAGRVIDTFEFEAANVIAVEVGLMLSRTSLTSSLVAAAAITGAYVPAVRYTAALMYSSPEMTLARSPESSVNISRALVDTLCAVPRL